MSDLDQTPETALAVVPVTSGSSNQVALLDLVKSILPNVDFTGLNMAIDNIGNHCGSITLEEKQAGIEIVSQWNDEVVRALHDRGQQIDQLIRFFGIYGDTQDRSYEDRLEELGPELSLRTSTAVELDAYVAARDALRTHRHDRPEKPEIEDGTGKLKETKIRQAYDYELVKWQLDEKKLVRRVRETEAAWKKLLNEHKDVQALVKVVRKQRGGIGALVSECGQKSQLAKVNIMISSKDIRDSLRQMLEFTKTV